VGEAPDFDDPVEGVIPMEELQAAESTLKGL
jgi:hypothetical protein